MKKLLILFLMGTVVVTTVPAQAASVGSPKTEGRGKVATTVEWSYVFGRDLGYEKATRPAGNDIYRAANFRISRGYNVAGRISYGIFDAIDIYVKLGAANYNFKGDVLAGDTKSVDENLIAGNSFLYGGGFKLAYELKKNWIIGCDAQYLTSGHELDFRAANLTTGVVTTAKYANCRLQEWQVAPFVAKKIAGFTPYLGVRYSDFRMVQKNPDSSKRWDHLVFRADYNVGVFTGIDWGPGKNFKLNVEGRFVDETALSIGATYKF